MLRSTPRMASTSFFFTALIEAVSSCGQPCDKIQIRCGQSKVSYALIPISGLGKFDVVDLLVSFSLIVLVFATGARAEVNGAGRYNADGPYAVTTAMLIVPLLNGAFTTTAYIPKDSRPHPVVIFSSGFMQRGIAYAPYAKRLASWGIVAFLQDDAALAYAPAKAKFPDEVSPDDNPRSQRSRSRPSPIRPRPGWQTSTQMWEVPSTGWSTRRG